MTPGDRKRTRRGDACRGETVHHQVYVCKRVYERLGLYVQSAARGGCALRCASSNAPSARVALRSRLARQPVRDYTIE